MSKPVQWCALLVALFPAVATAQVPIHSVEISGGYFAFGGDDLDGFNAGPRGQLSLLFDLDAPIALGVTGTYGRGDVDGLNGNYRELGFGATGRMSLAAAGSVGPYVALNAGWTRLSVDLPSGTPDVESNGFAIGPSAGLEIPLGSVHLTLGGEVLWQSMGDLRFSGSVGPGLGGGGAKGWRFGGEAGLVLGVGN